jgi:hypothetical protein
MSHLSPSPFDLFSLVFWCEALDSRTVSRDPPLCSSRRARYVVGGFYLALQVPVTGHFANGA